MFGPVVEVVTADVEKPPVIGAAAPSREPIAAAVGVGYQRFTHWWTTANLSTPIKVALVAGAILLLFLNSEWLVPMALVLGAVYLVYFGVRTVVVGSPGSQVP